MFNLTVYFKAKRGSIYDQVDVKPTFLNEFNDFDDFGALDLDPVDVDRGKKIPGVIRNTVPSNRDISKCNSLDDDR